MTGSELTDTAAIATIGTAVLAVLTWLGVHGWKALKRFSRFLDDYEGTEARPGVDARPGVMERLKNQDEALAAVQDAQASQAVVLADVQSQLGAVVDELPKNGVPLAEKIDALWSKYKAEQAAAAVAAVAGPAPSVVIHTGNQGGTS